jgi:hypothetical protein
MLALNAHARRADEVQYSLPRLREEAWGEPDTSASDDDDTPTDTAANALRPPPCAREGPGAVQVHTRLVAVSLYQVQA